MGPRHSPSLVAGLFLFSFALNAAHASDLNTERACQEIQQSKSQLPKISRFHALWDVLRVRLAPGSVIKLQEIDLSVLPSVPAASESGENIIFSIEPPQAFLNSPEFQQKQERYEAIQNTLESQKRKLTKIFKTKSVQECIQVSNDQDFDFLGFSKLAEEAKALALVGQALDAQKVRNTIEKTLKHLKLNWHVVWSTQVMDVYLALKSPNTRNIVILSHGVSGGKLVDSSLNEYPLGIFSELSPSLESISFFSCHDDESVSLYHVEDHLRESPTSMALRRVFYAQGAKLLGQQDVVPVEAFKSFMKKVDRRILDASRIESPKTTLDPSPVPAQCSIQISGLALARGTLGFSLNGRFIGDLDKYSLSTEFTFPCRYLDRAKNILVMRSLNLLEDALPVSAEYSVSVRAPGQTVKSGSLSHYYRSDKSYQSSKFEFELGAPL